MGRLGTVAEWRTWVVGGRYFWVSFLLAALGALALWLGPHTQDTVRRVGLCWEFIGVFAVAWEIAKTRRKNGLEPFWTRLRKYAASSPLNRDRSLVLRAQGSVLMLGDLSAATMGWNPPAGGDVQAQVNYLLRFTKALDERLQGHEKRTNEEVKALGDKLKAQAEAHEAAQKALQQDIKALEVGSLDLSAFGLVWLLIGMTLSTATLEVAWLLYACCGWPKVALF